MPIGKLDNAAVRVIGASQVLTDPATVVKELVDNALDAHATSIALDVHNNTLDVIQVRDNGHGIAPEDRAMVAIPNCTSKLVHIDDLKSVAGSSLGFRGQALAAAAELSGSMTVSTKVEGETVATALKINQSGEVVGQERVSLPVGTTVRITDFIKANPVRRQVALKNTEKCLKKIKQTLQAYAFARPHVRFSLKVLKAKDLKLNWIYPPKPHGSTEDVAIKIVGSACVSQCTWSIIEVNGFTLQGFIPRPDAEVAKVSCIGSYISIDARPVSASRGTLKQIVKIFRDSLKAANPAFEGVKEPFIYMRIICPAASYDPNVEPAKDDVLFENPDFIIDASRELFGAVYTPKSKDSDLMAQHMLKAGVPAQRVKPVVEDTDLSTGPQDSDSSVHYRPPINLSVEPKQRRLTTDVDSELLDDAGDAEDCIVPRRACRSNMYGCDEEDADMSGGRPSTGRTERDLEELWHASKDVFMSNPWVMAKLNASVRCPPPEASAPLPSSPCRHAAVPETPLLQPGLPTPRLSSPSPSADGLDSAHRPQSTHTRPERLSLVMAPASSPLRPQVVNAEHGHAGYDGLDSAHRAQSTQIHPEQLSSIMTPSLSSSRLQTVSADHDHARRYPANNYDLYSHAKDEAPGTPLDAIPDMRQRPRKSPEKRTSGRVNKPFVSPMLDQPPREKVWFDHLDNQCRPNEKARRPYQKHNTDGLVQQGELGDLRDEPRSLTPPKRNRDIRDFVDSVDLTGGGSAASIAERRMYIRDASRRSRSASADLRRLSVSGDENASPLRNLMSGRGFVPASEIAALERRFGSLDKQPTRSSKRRRTGGGVLRDVSGNVRARTHSRAESGDDTDDHAVALMPARTIAEDDDYVISETRTDSRRRRTTGDGMSRKATRTKSSRLPLERIPKGAGVQNIEYKLVTSLHEVSSWVGRIEEASSILRWNTPALDAYDAFADLPNEREIAELSEKLEGLLTSKVSNGEMVQNVASLLNDVFAARSRGDVETSMCADAVLVE